MIDWALKKLGFKPRIVTDGERFAVAKGWWFVELLDVSDREVWWFTKGLQTRYCWGTLEQAKSALAIIEQKNYWDYKDEQTDDA